MISLLLVGLFGQVNAQNQGTLSGSIQTNANFFQRDTVIGAQNTPQYDHQLFGGETWVTLNYSNFGFDVGVRYDLFNNSNLPNPQGSFNENGIGKWFIKKKLGEFDFAVGNLYDQIGSGIIYRAYEERPLFIDNSLLGARVIYHINEDWEVKGFMGKQKNVFDLYPSVVRGFNIDGFYSPKDETKNWSISPGFGVVSRTIDDKTMNLLVSNIKTYYATDSTKVFVPKYNTYAFTLYNNLSVGKFNWYAEAAFKSKDPARNGEYFTDGLGTVYYSSLSFATKGLGITLEGKRTENFEFRTTPLESLNRGLLNFIPPMTRINAYRLTTRYSAATQFLGENSFQVDVKYAPIKKVLLTFNVSRMTALDNNLLSQEIYFDAVYKLNRKNRFVVGVQNQIYNQDVFQFKPGVPLLKPTTPFVEYLHKMKKRRSIRMELQYMLMDSHTDDMGHTTKNDQGDWLFGLAEYTMGSHWIFTVSDMYNVAPGKNSPKDNQGNYISSHYPRFDIYYKLKTTRLSLSYVKQVEGVVCTGGICRLEPAFSGVKFTLNSNF